MTSARGPTEGAEASFASAPKAPRRLRAGRRPAARLRSQPRPGFGRGRYVRAAEPAAQEAGFRFLLVVVQREKPLWRRPYAGAARLEYHVPMTPEETRARLLYRDGMMLVLDKPAGVAVHAGRRAAQASRTISTPCVSDCRESRRSHIGSTATPPAAWCSDDIIKRWRNWGSCSSRARSRKTYWAIVAGAPEAESGAIDLPLGRLDDRRGWWMKVDPKGQPALTLWRVKGRGIWRGAPIAWLELEPQTGRTHQLRVHCASQGWPILGDAIYGARAERPAAAAGAQGRRAPVQGEAADRGRGARAAAYARGARGLRFCGRSAGGPKSGGRGRRDRTPLAYSFSDTAWRNFQPRRQTKWDRPCRRWTNCHGSTCCMRPRRWSHCRSLRGARWAAALGETRRLHRARARRQQGAQARIPIGRGAGARGGHGDHRRRLSVQSRPSDSGRRSPARPALPVDPHRLGAGTRAAYRTNGNLILDDLFGARIELRPGTADVDAEMTRAAERYVVEGRKPYIIPMGGSSALGLIGYVRAARELLEQARVQRVEFTHVVLASASGGTHAGLSLGLALEGSNAPVIGYCVGHASADLRPRIAALVRHGAELLGVDSPLTAEDLVLEDGVVGQGYGLPTPAMAEAVRLAPRRKASSSTRSTPGRPWPG